MEPIDYNRHNCCSQPNIVIKEKGTDKCLVIGVTILSAYNIQMKATEKMSKYVDLKIECQRMWNKKFEVTPVIIGTTGMVEKNLKKYLGRIPGHHNIHNIQRSEILSTGKYHPSSQSKQYETS